MNRQEVKQLFQPYINKLQDQVHKDFTEYVFDKLPEYWFYKPASSTGKYHPAFAQGDGGLIRHTLAMVKIFEVLWRGFEKEFYMPSLHDLGVIACIFHDALKYGRPETFPDGLKYTTKGHELDAAEWIGVLWDEFLITNYMDLSEIDRTKYEDDISCLTSAIEHHMGPWSKTGAPECFFDKLIFIADYMASSKWFEEEIFQ